jgi:cytochrome c peroxidase
MSLTSADSPPPSVSNSFASDPAAAELGRKLFFDTRLSGNGKISCASCHQPEKRFTDGLAGSIGSEGAMRNSPSVIGVAYQAWFYWDGRRDSLWSQALVPFEAKEEMGSSRLAVLRVVTSDADYRKHYESLFGKLPDALMNGSLPFAGGPYSEPDIRQVWFSLPVNLQRELNRAFANLGKAIEAYERTLLPEPTRFDRYVQALSRGEKLASSEALTVSEVAGARLFIDSEKTQCLQCHNGPMLSNGGFHNIGTGVFQGLHMDFGREIGLRSVLMDEFNCLGPYSDARPEQCVELRFLNRDSHLPLRGAFKVPSLRGLGDTAPYFHDGRFNTLAEVLDYYNLPPNQEAVGAHELKPMNLTAIELQSLEDFLDLLSD